MPSIAKRAEVHRLGKAEVRSYGEARVSHYDLRPTGHADIQFSYIYPASLRKRMSDIWGVDVTGWWLPNDEGYPPVLRALRDFIDFRAMSAAMRRMWTCETWRASSEL